MTDNSSMKPGVAPRLYMTVICVAVPEFTTEVQFLDFPMMAHSAEQAVDQLQFIFTLRAYDPETKSWNMGGVPCNPWHIFAVEYPEALAEKIMGEMGISFTPSMDGSGTTAPDVFGQVVSLFPQKVEKPDGDDPSKGTPPDDNPPEDGS